MKRLSIELKLRKPLFHRITTAHSRLHQTVDHKGRGHMNAILPGVFAVPFDDVLKLGLRERFSQLHAAVAFQSGNDVVRRGVEIRSAGVVLEFEFGAMRSNGCHHGLGRIPAAFKGRGGQDAAHDDAGKHVPRLGLETYFDREAVFASLFEQLVELAKSLDRERARGLKEYLKDARAVAPCECVCLHVLLSREMDDGVLTPLFV